jgi:hypothetical protein
MTGISENNRKSMNLQSAKKTEAAKEVAYFKRIYGKGIVVVHQIQKSPLHIALVEFLPAWEGYRGKCVLPLAQIISP